MPWIRRFDDPDLDLATAGGKAVNLARLTRAGFPVPEGFVVTTEAYRHFVSAAGLQPQIEALLGRSDDVDSVSHRIRELIRAAPVPGEVAAAVRAAYRALVEGAPGGADGALDDSADSAARSVAVRSSATAEDLPELSFAGQQDSFLHVVGEDAVVDAVRDCWSSLWTARALSYRRNAGIPDATVALAVAVQRLVPAEASGVLFTADPLTGHRGHMVLDATFGLGEALVSGQVEPDHVVADAATGRVLTRAVGAKAVVTEPVAGGGVRLVPRRPAGTGSGAAVAEAALTDAQVAQLVALGRRIAAEYATPQDIEWVLHDGRLHVVQSRAITSLYPVPDGAAAESVWLSFGAVQGMLAPMTPLGRDAVACVLSAGAGLFGHRVDPRANPALGQAGERIWVRLDRAWRHPVGAPVLRTVLPFVDPSARQIVAGLAEEPMLAPLAGAQARAARRRFAGDLAHFVPRAFSHLPRVLARPEWGRDRFDAVIADLLCTVRARHADAATEPDPIRRVAARARAMGWSLSQAFPTIAPWVAPMIAPSVAALRALSWIAGSDATSHGPDVVGHGVSPLAMAVTRAVPHNPTTEMDLALWDAAAQIGADPASRAVVEAAEPDELAAGYRAGTLPEPAQRALTRFFAAYGMRGVGEIDLGRPRWREEPADILRTVQAYLALAPENSPREVFARGEREAADAVAALRARAAGMPRGRLRAVAVRVLARRVRALTGAREQPKFTVIQIMGVCREALLASGSDLVELGLLAQPEDIFFLHLDELQHLPGSDLGRLAGLVAARRAAYRRESRRARVPRVLVGDGRAFHEGVGSRATGATGDLVGSPVSPGVVEGLVRVVHDPGTAGLQPGEILVCRGTDPAWTPLFLTAAGLVTEVGGMMTHGSVVAREYGIPAVVGVHEATTRLATGDRIRLDGAIGTIEVVSVGVGRVTPGSPSRPS